MAGSGTWAVLPVKAFDDAKSRLQPVLDAQQRRDLARSLMLHSLRTLRAASGLDGVLVVSTDPEALTIAEDQGAAVMAESGADLNAALVEARVYAVARGATSLLVLASDLPLLTGEDIVALTVAGGESGVIIASDRSGQGTNAVLLRPSDAIEFSFGPFSFQRHIDLASAAGLKAIEVSRPGLAFDIDLPHDWRDLLASGWTGLSSTEPSPRGA